MFSCQLESECIALRKARDSLETANGPLEQKCHELSQQLQISTLAVRELEDAQRHQDLAASSSARAGEELERQVEALRGQTQELREQLELKGDKMAILEEVSWVQA